VNGLVGTIVPFNDSFALGTTIKPINNVKALVRLRHPLQNESSFFKNVGSRAYVSKLGFVFIFKISNTDIKNTNTSTIDSPMIWQ